MPQPRATLAKKKRGRKNTNTKFKNIKYFGGLATSTTTSSRTPVSFVSSPLATGNSLLSLSDKSAVAVVGDLDTCFVRHPAVWWVDFGVVEWGVICAATTAAVGVLES